MLIATNGEVNPPARSPSRISACDYSFDLPTRASFFAHSLRTFLWILPAALLGTSSTKTTPPVKYLCLATLLFIHSWISSELAAPSDVSRTYARGYSWAPKESRTPTTPASAMAGWVRRTASSSAGATWRPETLMSSYEKRSVPAYGSTVGREFHLQSIHNVEPPPLVIDSHIPTPQPAALEHGLPRGLFVLPIP